MTAWVHLYSVFPSLTRCVPNVISEPQCLLEITWKPFYFQITGGPTPRASYSLGLGVGLRICIFHKFTRDAAADIGTIL